MAIITAALVSELRKMTGAGMMDCKKALQETAGDLDKAVEFMRKQGQVKATRKADRTAAEGLIIIKTNAAGNQAYILEINCETDFVARDDNFKQFAETAINAAVQTQVDNVEALLALEVGAEKNSIEKLRQELIAKIGENIQLRRLQVLHAAMPIATYIHNGRIGVLVALDQNNPELGKDIAMHIAATSPQVLAAADIPAELLAKEKEIYLAQGLESGKPAEAAEKFAESRLRQFSKEISLLEQPFVKDTSVKIAELLQKSGAQVLAFVRYQVGEGIAKKTANFAEEVMAQVSH